MREGGTAMAEAATNRTDRQDSYERKKESLVRTLGDLALSALKDPKTVELLLNDDGVLWQERLGEDMEAIGRIDPGQALAIVSAVAGINGDVLTEKSPWLEGEFPLDGSRFTAMIPPVVQAASFTLRKHAIAVFTLEDYVRKNIMTAAQAAVIRSAIIEHRNILVVGGTGSGKTTLLNAIIDAMTKMCTKERLVIIEDTREIQCKAPNRLPLKTAKRAEPPITMTDLVKGSLRLRPDRIFVGEVRGPEALDLLMAWNTGHPGGAASVHANDAIAGMDRMELLISMHPNCPTARLQALIASTVNVVVHISRDGHGSRRVKEILKVNGLVEGRYQLQPIEA
ncbi:type IV secretion system protein VirB11 [Azospirillum brasilense]|nr:type IV secretion system protein VirB11 [Azospirillum brasilense]